MQYGEYEFIQMIFHFIIFPFFPYESRQFAAERPTHSLDKGIVRGQLHGLETDAGNQDEATSKRSLPQDVNSHTFWSLHWKAKSWYFSSISEVRDTEAQLRASAYERAAGELQPHSHANNLNAQKKKKNPTNSTNAYPFRAGQPETGFVRNLLRKQAGIKDERNTRVAQREKAKGR